MAKKAYRELSEAERKHHSLSARVSRYVVIGAAILGVTMLIIGLALYSVAVSNQYTMLCIEYRGKEENR